MLTNIASSTRIGLGCMRVIISLDLLGLMTTTSGTTVISRLLPTTTTTTTVISCQQTISSNQENTSSQCASTQLSPCWRLLYWYLPLQLVTRVRDSWAPDNSSRGHALTDTTIAQVKSSIAIKSSCETEDEVDCKDFCTTREQTSTCLASGDKVTCYCSGGKAPESNCEERCLFCMCPSHPTYFWVSRHNNFLPRRARQGSFR